MKKRFLFLVQRRGGGTLFNRLLGQIDDADVSKPLYLEPVQLPTEEPCLCYMLYSLVPEIIASGKLDPNKTYAFCQYAEGDISDPTKPLYSHAVPAWASPNLEKCFPSAKWEIISLVRDGRDHVTSLLRGEHINKISKHEKGETSFLDNLEEFKEQCYLWKFKTRLHLDCAKNHPHFHIMKYEDMLKNPREFMENILKRLGFSPRWTKEFSLSRNSSTVWNDKANPKRMDYWSNKHIEICKKIMAPELAELGYAGNGID